MENGIITIRNWIRTNGSMSEDGKSITYDCAELEKTINEALMQTAVVGQSEQFKPAEIVHQLNQEETIDDAKMYYQQKIKV